MAIANVYLTFNGNCEDAFNFYRSVLGGEFTYMGRFSEMPPMEGSKSMPEADANKIMHVSLPVSKETILMGSDTGGEWASDFKPGNNFSISGGGVVKMPMNQTFWGDYFGMFTDKFGVNWMISFNEQFKN